MKELPYLNHADFVYTRLKAITWVANQSVLPSVVQAKAGIALYTLIRVVEPNKPILINCRGINYIEDHALDTLKEALALRDKPTVFLHATQLKEDLQRAL